MPIQRKDLLNKAIPFFIVPDCKVGKRKGLPRKVAPSKVIGCSANDPLGVGGEGFACHPTVHFENGGRLLLEHLLKHHSIVEVDHNQRSHP